MSDPTTSSSQTAPENEAGGGPDRRTNLPKSWQRILAPVDFSDRSLSSLRAAVELAEMCSAELTALHVVQPYYIEAYGYGGVPNFSEELVTSAESHLARWAEEEIGDRVPHKTVVLQGQPYFEIVEYARDCAADAIVVSTHGRSGLSHVLLGSVAERIVRHAPCAVIVDRIWETKDEDNE